MKRPPAVFLLLFLTGSSCAGGGAVLSGTPVREKVLLRWDWSRVRERTIRWSGSLDGTVHARDGRSRTEDITMDASGKFISGQADRSGDTMVAIALTRGRMKGDLFGSRYDHRLPIRFVARRIQPGEPPLRRGPTSPSLKLTADERGTTSVHTSTALSRLFRSIGAPLGPVLPDQSVAAGDFWTEPVNVFYEGADKKFALPVTFTLEDLRENDGDVIADIRGRFRLKQNIDSSGRAIDTEYAQQVLFSVTRGAMIRNSISFRLTGSSGRIRSRARFDFVIELKE